MNTPIIIAAVMFSEAWSGDAFEFQFGTALGNLHTGLTIASTRSMRIWINIVAGKNQLITPITERKKIPVRANH